MTKWDASQDFEGCTTCKNQLMNITYVNRLKKKVHMIVSIDAVKAFDKITNFHGKNTQQTRNRMDLLQPDRAFNKTLELIYSVAKD